MSIKVEGTGSNTIYENNKVINENEKTDNGEKIKENGKNIYAGNLHLPGDDIAEKKAKAGRDAIKTLLEQFEDDIEQDELVGRLKENIDKLQEDIPEYNKNIERLNGSLENIEKNFGIEADSPEKAELELRRKAQNGEKLTPKEMDTLASMGEATEYQKYALDIYKQIDYFKGRIESIDKAVTQCNKSLTDISISRLKNQGMLKARKEAEEILSSVNKEIMDMAMQDAVDTIDKKQEENEEKADKVKEEKDKEEEKEKEKLKEKIEKDIKQSEKTKNMPAGTVGAVYTGDIFEDDKVYQAIMEEVKNIADMNALSEEDIKGLLADLEL